MTTVNFAIAFLDCPGSNSYTIHFQPSMLSLLACVLLLQSTSPLLRTCGIATTTTMYRGAVPMHVPPKRLPHFLIRYYARFVQSDQKKSACKPNMPKGRSTTLYRYLLVFRQLPQCTATISKQPQLSIYICISLRYASRKVSESLLVAQFSLRTRRQSRAITSEPLKSENQTLGANST